jgi:hypothetical protein
VLVLAGGAVHAGAHARTGIHWPMFACWPLSGPMGVVHACTTVVVCVCGQLCW